jgi:hypothetical protein
MTVLQAALTGSNTSTVLNVSTPSKLWIEIEGTFGGGSVAMQQSGDGTTYSAFTADGSAVEWTAANMVQLEVPSGWYRFVASGVTTVAVAYELVTL